MSDFNLPPQDEINPGVLAQAQDLFRRSEEPSPTDTAAAELLVNLPKLLKQENARAYAALRQQENAGPIGRLIFNLKLRRDPILRESIESIRTREHNEEAKRSAIRNEGRHIIF